MAKEPAESRSLLGELVQAVGYSCNEPCHTVSWDVGQLSRRRGLG